MNIEMLKDKLSSYAQKYNLTFAKKISKRKEFLFSLGESKFLPKEVLWESENFVLIGEGVEERDKIEISKIFDL